MDFTGAQLITAAHEPELHAFLARHADSSLFLRSNLHSAGLVDDGTPCSGTYAGWWEAGQLVGVVAHAWNHNLLLQAPTHAGPLAHWLALHTGRPLRGICGPREQLEAARVALGRAQAATLLDTYEDLFALPLAQLRAPPERAEVTFRAAHASDTPLLAAWRADFWRSEQGADARIDHGDVLVQTQRAQASGCAFVLEAHGQPVAMCSHSARIPDCVQLGGVWTPPSQRNRGYGRRVVAGALQAALHTGRTRGILFTPRDNAPAQAVYRGLGFTVVGDYGLVQWRDLRPLEKGARPPF